jgi:hypothetical protein
MPPVGDRTTHTPGYFAASWSSMETVGERAISSAVTAVVGAGFGAIGSASPTGLVLGGAGAQARTSPIMATDLIIGEI